jgi:hypothetical protein
LVSSDGEQLAKPVYARFKLNSIYFYDINTGYAAGCTGSMIKNISNHFYIDNRKLDANMISALYRNDGGFNSDGGFEWPKGSGKYAVYESGICVGAIVGNDTLLATAMHEAEYYPRLHK